MNLPVRKSADTPRVNASRLAVALSLALATQASLAWGGLGHGMVAEAAQLQLTPAARSELTRLLEPGATLASISTWADEVRAPSTARWHYVNLPRDSGCSYEATRDCPDGACVVAAIQRQAGILASTAPDAERLKALKWLTHLVADVHQPLHAGFGDDRGGNLYQVRFGGRGTNLHAVWDSGLVQAWPGGVSDLGRRLRTEVSPRSTPPQESAQEPIDPARWAEESCRAASSPDFYPAGHVLPADYADRMAPVLVERLSTAARHLAAVLNKALGGRPAQ